MKFRIVALTLVATLSHVFIHADTQQQNTTQQPECDSKHFEGFSVSAGAGYSGVTLDTQRSGIKPRSDTRYGGDGVGVQLKAGYDYGFCDMGLVGLEVYGQYNSAETQNKFFETTTSTTATQRTFSLPWNIGVDAKLGLAPNPDCLVFIFGGADWGYYDFHYVTTGVNNRFERFKIGGAFGAGLQQMFGDHLFLKLTVDYRWYASEKITYSNGEIQDIKARLATGVMTIGWLF